MDNKTLIKEHGFLDKQIEDNEDKRKLYFWGRVDLLSAMEVNHWTMRKKKREELKKEIKILLDENRLQSSKLGKEKRKLVVLRDRLKKKIIKNISSSDNGDKEIKNKEGA